MLKQNKNKTQYKNSQLHYFDPKAVPFPWYMCGLVRLYTPQLHKYLIVSA